MIKKIVIVVMLVALLSVVGCGEEQMSPRMQQVVKMSAINVANMNRDCQAGNDESCKQGLAEAARTLELIVEAL